MTPWTCLSRKLAEGKSRVFSVILLIDTIPFSRETFCFPPRDSLLGMTQQPICQFSDRLSSALTDAENRSHSSTASTPGHSHDSKAHSHDGGMMTHSHGDGGGIWTPDEHGHTHEHLEHAGMTFFDSGLGVSWDPETDEVARWVQANSQRGICPIIHIEIGPNELSPLALEGDATIIRWMSHVGLTGMCDSLGLWDRGRLRCFLRSVEVYETSIILVSHSTRKFKLRLPSQRRCISSSKPIPSASLHRLLSSFPDLQRTFQGLMLTWTLPSCGHQRHFHPGRPGIFDTE